MEKNPNNIIESSGHLFPQYRDGVIYVTPSGIAFERKTLIRYYETWQRVVNTMTEAAKAVIKVVKNVWQRILEIFKRLTEHIKSGNRTPVKRRDIRRSWVVPLNTVKPSQVWNRKPMYTRIRRHI